MHQHCATKNPYWERALPQKSFSQYFLGFSLATSWTRSLHCQLLGLFGLARAGLGRHLSFNLLTAPDLVRSGRRGGFLHPVFKGASVGCSKKLGFYETIATCCGMQQLMGYVVVQSL